MTQETMPSAASINEESRFTGSVFSWFGVRLAVILGTLFTLGLAYPALVCYRERYIASHTVINGRNLYFNGKGIQLFGKYIQWALLTLITCGIYTFWRKLKMRKWILSHTHFVGVQEHSDFDGGLLELTFIGWIANIVSLITLGIASFWMNCWKERYYAKHSIIDGHRLYFTGTGGQYFAKKIVWLLLTVITCGIYSFWLAQRVKKWEVKHTQVECPESIPFDQMAWDAYQAEMGLRTSPEWKNATLLFIIGLISIPNMPILPIVLFFLSANNAKKVKRSGLYGIATFLAFILIFLYIVVALFVVVMLSGIELPFGWKFG